LFLFPNPVRGKEESGHGEQAERTKRYLPKETTHNVLRPVEEQSEGRQRSADKAGDDVSWSNRMKKGERQPTPVVSRGFHFHNGSR
jgi:hypothetical protein